MQKFNTANYEDVELKTAVLNELFGSVGKGIFIEHNFHCDLGYNIHVGENFYAGFNCTILDMAKVKIGDNVWIGRHCAIIGGIKIGDNSIIAAGSVVIKDVPENTLFAGNPAIKIKDIDSKEITVNKA